MTIIVSRANEPAFRLDLPEVSKVSSDSLGCMMANLKAGVPVIIAVRAAFTPEELK